MEFSQFPSPVLCSDPSTKASADQFAEYSAEDSAELSSYKMNVLKDPMIQVLQLAVQQNP